MARAKKDKVAQGEQSGAKAAGGGRGDPPPPDSSEEPTAFILSRARSEVHLLLDNISANPEVTIATLAEQTKPKGLPANWIEKVCEITWPPTRGHGVGELADQAALLIKSRDYLNGLAKPASGATIAFTLMVTQNENRTIRRRRSEQGAARSPSRTSLAAEAYPDLVDEALSFRSLLLWTRWAAFAALLLTLALSWYLAAGNAALADYAAARSALVEAETRVGAAQSALNGGAGPPQGGAQAPPQRPAASAASPRSAAPQRRALPPGQPIQPPPVVQPSPVAPAPPAPASNYLLYPCQGLRFFPSAELRDACLTRKLVAERFVAVRAGIDTWSPFTGPDAAGWWANLLGSGVLPVLYGFLGAIASVVRSLSRKIKGSLLSPRDAQLTLDQLALGAVVGACISLFIPSPAGGSGDTSLIGPVALSSSAIAFVAGFGVDSVFQALEGLISRIFNIAPAGGAPQPSGERRRP